jgi:hypothetical protein
MASPSLVSRLSTTRESGYRQNGQRTVLASLVFVVARASASTAVEHHLHRMWRTTPV